MNDGPIFDGFENDLVSVNLDSTDSLDIWETMDQERKRNGRDEMLDKPKNFPIAPDGKFKTNL